jgi:hypothetical protein
MQRARILCVTEPNYLASTNGPGWERIPQFPSAHARSIKAVAVACRVPVCDGIFHKDLVATYLIYDVVQAHGTMIVKGSQGAVDTQIFISYQAARSSIL